MYYVHYNMLSFSRLVCNKFPAQSHVYKRHVVLRIIYGPGETVRRKLDIQTDLVPTYRCFDFFQKTIQLAKTNEKQ